MKIWCGTSGFSYDTWRGHFYPADLRSDERLQYLAERIGTVEINNTFHRMPRPAQLEQWCSQAARDFRFTLKVPRRITHSMRLSQASYVALGLLLDAFQTLKDRRGALLFQTPPTLRPDLPLLRAFLDQVPRTLTPHCAFEFRNTGWLDDAIVNTIIECGATLVYSDADERSSPWPLTRHLDLFPWQYIRLRRGQYSDEQRLQIVTVLSELAQRSKNPIPRSDSYVYFKHESLAPNRAIQLAAALET